MDEETNCKDRDKDKDKEASALLHHKYNTLNALSHCRHFSWNHPARFFFRCVIMCLACFITVGGYMSYDSVGYSLENT